MGIWCRGMPAVLRKQRFKPWKSSARTLLVCLDCMAPVSSESGCFEAPDGKCVVLCDGCLGPKSCAGCRRTIHPSADYISPNGTDQERYHVECFCCDECQHGQSTTKWKQHYVCSHCGDNTLRERVSPQKLKKWSPPAPLEPRVQRLRRRVTSLPVSLWGHLKTIARCGCSLPTHALEQLAPDGKPRSGVLALLLFAGMICLYLDYLTLLEAVLLPTVLCLVTHWALSQPDKSVSDPHPSTPPKVKQSVHPPPQATELERARESKAVEEAAAKAKAAAEKAAAEEAAAKAAVAAAKAEEEATKARAAARAARSAEQAAAAKAALTAAKAAEEKAEARADAAAAATAARAAEEVAVAKAAEISKLRRQVADLEVDKAAEVYKLRKESEQDRARVRDELELEMQHKVRDELEDQVRGELAHELQQEVGEQLLWLTEAVEATDAKYDARMVEVHALRQQVVSLQSRLAEDSGSSSRSRSSTPPSPSVRSTSQSMCINSPDSPLQPVRRASVPRPPSSPPAAQRASPPPTRSAPATPPQASAGRSQNISWPPPPPSTPPPALDLKPAATSAELVKAATLAVNSATLAS